MLDAVTSMDLITGFLSFLFTVLVLSYVIGDNPGFRLAMHAFIGISAGYVTVVVLEQVIVDKMVLPMFTGSVLDRVLMFFPLLLGLLLLTKMSSSLEWLGRPVVAILVGVGTASAVAGAVLGTLFPQVLSAAQYFDPAAASGAAWISNLLTGVFALAGTIVTLVYFQFSVSAKNALTGQRGRLTAMVATLGRVLIAITLGAIFAGVLAASLTALVDRIQSLMLFVEQLMSTFIK